MSGTAFVYGTLMADEVLKLLIRRVPPSKPAKLAGYSRHRVKGQVFPAIIPAAPKDTVQGKASTTRLVGNSGHSDVSNEKVICRTHETSQGLFSHHPYV